MARSDISMCVWIEFKQPQLNLYLNRWCVQIGVRAYEYSHVFAPTCVCYLVPIKLKTLLLIQSLHTVPDLSLLHRFHGCVFIFTWVSMSLSECWHHFSTGKSKGGVNKQTGLDRWVLMLAGVCLQLQIQQRDTCIVPLSVLSVTISH